MRPGSAQPNQRLSEASGRLWGCQEVDSAEFIIRSSWSTEGVVATRTVRACRAILTRPGSFASVPGCRLSGNCGHEFLGTGSGGPASPRGPIRNRRIGSITCRRGCGPRPERTRLRRQGALLFLFRLHHVSAVVSCPASVPVAAWGRRLQRPS